MEGKCQGLYTRGKRREAIRRGFGFMPYASLLKGREWKEYLKKNMHFLCQLEDRRFSQ